MPAREVAAKRYAQAVFALARDTGAFDPWRADLATIAALFADPTVAGYLASSKVPEAEKFVLLQRALPDVQPLALNLARLLVRKRRAALAPGIAEAFGAQLNTERGVAVARVTTAVPLSDGARAALIEAIQRGFGATSVDLHESVSREILGGAVIRVGDHLIDGSIATRLQHLRRSIAGSVR